MIKLLKEIEDVELVIPTNKGINDVKFEDCERISIKRLPNNGELMDKINEIIEVVNSIRK